MDEFKTQVLLLHSEQGTLDNFRSEFTDRYTVHCATSGSEALNTLVQTPINVLISAHDLPGMSGLDALREAKKRSPNTIGILLAGSTSTDISALIRDDDVFQVVSGTVTGKGLLTLVDSATEQMRVMTVPESANDTSADFDTPTEHIIMETAENGSTIITDGTGRLPVLDPEKVDSAPNVGSGSIDVLVLTKDPEFLATIQSASRGMHKIHHTTTLGQSNEAIQKNKIGVAIVDAGLAGEKIEQVTKHLRISAPRLVSIVAGRRADGEMLMDLVNRGKVYRFLLKPVSPGRARLAVESSVKHHLEAPDAAFESEAPQAKPPVAKNTAQPAAVQSAAPKDTPTAAPADPPLGAVAGPQGNSPIEDKLADATGNRDSGFQETATGMTSSVNKKLSETGELNSADTAVLASESGESQGGKLKVLGIAATVLAVIAGASFWFLKDFDWQAFQDETGLRTPSVVEADVALEPEPPVVDTAAVNALVDQAHSARDAGRIFEPDGDNAIEFFAAAIEIDPDNSVIASELNTAIGQALALAESAMLESRLDDSGVALQRVASVDPQNGRLPFLNAQLSQMRLRSELDVARAAIRESRFEDAQTALIIARGLNVADTTAIETVSAELNAARGEQRVDAVLATANARLDSGDLLTPSNDNARYYFQLALNSDRNNAAARQGLSVIASKLAYEARSEIDTGELRSAYDKLASARALDPSNSEVAATNRALQAKLAEIADQERLAEAERVAEAERLAEEQRAAEALAAAAASGASLESAPGDPAQASINQRPVTVSSLTRTKYAAPKYPRSAQRRGQSGWVDVVFTVLADGTVADIEIRDSDPGSIFDTAAIRAIEKWEFEPVTENGAIVEKRAGVRLMFALE